MFETLKALPPDPILGLMAAFRQDNNPKKIDLGVGVYKDEQGNTPVMQAVKVAEERLMAAETTKSYVGPAGEPGFNAGMLNMLFGADHSALKANRIRGVQTPGGCGGLRVGAELVKRAKPDATIWVSNPTWANHIPLMGNAGLAIKEYPYFDARNSRIDFDPMMSTLATVPAGDLVLLHGCCHNPSGADLNREQWQAVADLAVNNGFVPFIDTAYQGLGDGLEEDAYGLRLVAEKVPELVLVASCSKNFGLYRERTGLVAVLNTSPEQADATATQVVSVTRGSYSMPPAHGGSLVDMILHDSELNAMWQAELDGMRDRINTLRHKLVDGIAAKGVTQDFSFIKEQKGMFSFLGISPKQVERLRKEFSVYVVSSSRVNIAGVNDANLDYLTDAIAAVV